MVLWHSIVFCDHVISRYFSSYGNNLACLVLLFFYRLSFHASKFLLLLFLLLPSSQRMSTSWHPSISSMLITSLSLLFSRLIVSTLHSQVVLQAMLCFYVSYIYIYIPIIFLNFTNFRWIIAYLCIKIVHLKNIFFRKSLCFDTITGEK